MDLNIDSLVIEVTRKCNMNCEHCLRGEAQNITISDHHIYKILQFIDNVSTLTITGGEPTLAIDSLKQISHCINYGRADVGSFYMVTNGKAIHVDDVAKWIHDMHFACSDNETSGVAFSFDDYHTQTFNYKQLKKQERNFNNLRDKINYEYGINSECYSDFIIRHSSSSSYPGGRGLLTQGRAKYFGTKDNSIEIFEEDETDDDICFRDTELYLSANGNIVVACDWSYDSIDNNKDIRIGHIDDITCRMDLIEAIKAYNMRRKAIEIDEKELAGVYEEI